jgi:glucoamylase
VDVANVATDGNSATLLTSTTAGNDGKFTVPVTLQKGTNVLVIAVTAPGGGTAQALRTVVNDVVTGTKLLDVTDPTNDDNGPGNYAYPTAPDFHPGAYDLTDFQVYDTGSTVTFRVQTRDLTPTFGSPLGAQLIDVYVHVPGATSTSTNAAFATRNYTIAASDAWNRLIEVQGFGQQFVDPSGKTLGTVTIGANAVSRFITFSVQKAQLGATPTSGWAFTVTLAGQDGFSSDEARAFTATPDPGGFTFGVCASASNDPHCTVSPTTVPKVMDTIVPSGTTQTAELDYVANHPVVLTGVAIP